MAQLSKNGLLVQNNQSFPNNSTGFITPEKLRDYNVDMIDSTVNQTVYTSASAAWDTSISALNTFTASQQPSFNALNAFTQSQLVINSGVNSFTQSAGGRLNNLESTTASLNAWSSSINEIRDDGVLQGYSTRFYFNGLVSASVIQNVGGPIANVTIEQDGTKLNTSSFDAYKTTINAYTASTNIRLNNLETFSSSANISITSLNAYTASTNIRLNNLETFSSSANISITSLNAFTASVGPVATGSLVTTSSFSGTTITFTKGNGTTYTNVGIQDTASFNSYTASVNTTTASLNTSVSNLNTFTSSANIRLNNLETTTASLNISVTNINSTTASLNFSVTNLNSFSSSQLSKDATLATYTGSNDTKWTTLGLYTASVNITTASLNTYTGSNDTKWNTLGLLTGSFATTGSNTFIGNQTITGSSTFTGSIVTTGSVVGNVVSMSIASSTASMDLNTGNFFTLTLPGNASTRINLTNIKPGQTANLILTTGTLSTASFATNVKFATGSIYVPTQINGATDIITFISFDNSTIYASSIKTLV